ncbi:MAG: GNAT family N-acetyltransferase [candidate division Zixibacteria bacterium]|nr:GNAT family N-acetyltransferase [candidate division Zixibacteria bacterium]
MKSISTILNPRTTEQENDTVVEILPWDTSFIGVKTGKVKFRNLTEETVAEVMLSSRNSGIELLYYECDIGDRESIRAAESGGFNLIETRLRFIKEIEHDIKKPLNIRKATIEDCEVLGEIASSINWKSRYYFDENIHSETSRELYRVWIKNSIKGFEDTVLVFEDGSDIAGFISGKYGEDIGDIGLVGVSPDYTGKGCGSILIQAIENDFAGKGLNDSRVLTQGRNIPAQRLYTKAGYKIERLTYYYHKWFRK